jgi:hypothetical protein
MSTSIEMSRIVANATGFAPETTLALVRRLGEKGLISRGGRGSNAPQMTELDWARMLLSILVSDRPSDGPRAIEVFGQLRLAAGGIPTGDTDLKSMLVGETFELGFADALRKFTAAKPSYLKVTAHVTDIMARIDFAALRYDYIHPTVSEQANQKAPDFEAFHSLRAQYRNSKVGIVRTFRPNILNVLANAFRKEGQTP